MNPKVLSELTDQELLQEAKKMKTTSLINAALIGFLAGVVVYSVAKNTWGFLTLIPIFIAYKLINRSRHEREELENLLKARNLK